VDAVLAVDYTFAESLHDGCQLQYGLKLHRLAFAKLTIHHIVQICD
jgi:hypothetical protein